MKAALDCSWLICTNTHDDRLVAAIASCLAQEAAASEIIVVCNGLQSAEIAESIRREFADEASVVVLETQIAQLIFSLNLGLHRARGRYIARMDADDLAYPFRLAAQFEFMERNPDICVCGTDYDLIDDNDQVIRRVAVLRDDARIRSKLTWSNPFCHPTTMIRRSVLVGAGGYYGGLYAEDYDLWVRLSLVPGWRFANLPIAGIGYRATPQGTARRARAAYASVASTQFRCFANGLGWRWAIAAVATSLKSLLRGRRSSV